MENKNNKNNIELKNKLEESNKKDGVKVGIIAGFLASLCCIGPIIIILFGLGSVSFALSITKYKPYFLALSIIFMISVIIIYLKRKSKVCKVNCLSLNGIKKERRFIILIILIMMAVYLLIMYVITPFIFKILG